MHDAVAARERRIRLRSHERRPAHRLDTARDEEIPVARDHRVRGADNGSEARGAEAVDGHAADRLGEAGEQSCEARDVAVVLPRLVRTAEPHVLDLRRRDTGPLDGRGDRNRRQIVRANAGESASVPADRRPHGREDDCVGHASDPSEPRAA